MFDDILKGFGYNGCGCGEPHPKKCSTSCDVLWIIILLMVVLKGGLFGLDLCTLIILLIVFGKDLFGRFGRPCEA
jgi:hypothetical protein